MVETVMGITDLQIKLFTAIGQISVAAAVGLIAYRQWRTAEQQAATARKKLKADLFDRRLAAFEELETTITALTRHWPAEDLCHELSHHARKFGYLFGAPVAKAVRELEQISKRAAASENALREPATDEPGNGLRRAGQRENVRHQRMKFGVQAAHLRDLIATDLKLSH
ncbi:hypothetical protein Q0S19_03535 [Stenotrophomonas indicatrix]|uniref:hypothetical protein n=1 Tax=Stenotrophomonas indicatrix TaxID=2045451 RepID=UPI00264D49DD|nr:hypothetical protein [Stenotrophomonas indicatrix]MDN8643540.1 hypothetical protein [Stenotrophomonas indicatrix]MDN8655338.1 hypothetical protein [Stenotrophomonas indicatrix]